MIRSILWFRQDLRLHDNEALQEAIRNSDELIPVYIVDPKHFIPVTKYGTPKTGIARTRFLVESIHDLRQRLRNIGSDLFVRMGEPQQALLQLVTEYKVHFIYCNRERTQEEVDVQDHLEKKLWTIGCEVRYSRGKMLYYTSDLPFPVTHCPDSFAVFKKEIEQLIPVRAPFEIPSELPPMPGGIESGEIPDARAIMTSPGQEMIHYFTGGETAGLAALREKTIVPPSFLSYEGTMLSPWVAMGCLSPKQVYYEAHRFENRGDEIQQHLIYRDYLRLMAKKYGNLIFYKSGIKGMPLKNKTDRQALQKWQEGKTGVAIIDAAMHQLNQTGWLPDTLRRLVAGYFIKVLNLDWRLGAAWFEARLIDYDPCTNWVSWLNLAGIGPDTREDKVINYEAFGRRIDPEGIYTRAWVK